MMLSPLPPPLGGKGTGSRVGRKLSCGAIFSARLVRETVLWPREKARGSSEEEERGAAVEARVVVVVVVVILVRNCLQGRTSCRISMVSMAQEVQGHLPLAWP